MKWVYPLTITRRTWQKRPTPTIPSRANAVIYYSLTKFLRLCPRPGFFTLQKLPISVCADHLRHCGCDWSPLKAGHVTCLITIDVTLSNTRKIHMYLTLAILRHEQKADFCCLCHYLLLWFISDLITVSIYQCSFVLLSVSALCCKHNLIVTQWQWRSCNPLILIPLSEQCGALRVISPLGPWARPIAPTAPGNSTHWTSLVHRFGPKHLLYITVTGHFVRFTQPTACWSTGVDITDTQVGIHL